MKAPGARALSASVLFQQGVERPQGLALQLARPARRHELCASCGFVNARQRCSGGCLSQGIDAEAGAPRACRRPIVMAAGAHLRQHGDTVLPF